MINFQRLSLVWNIPGKVPGKFLITKGHSIPFAPTKG